MALLAPYQLTVGTDLSITISRNATAPLSLCYWRGPIVRYLFESKVLPGEFHRMGTYPCDKCVVWHLILAAAAVRCLLGEHSDQNLS